MELDGFKLLREEADSGNSDSMLKLALAYKDGVSIKADSQEFFTWIKKAADAGQPEAKRELAIAYKEGNGTKIDVARYVALLQEQAKFGNKEAIYELAFAYKTGQGIPEKDLDGFFKQIKRLAEMDDADGMYELAFAYKDGFGSKRSSKSFFRWIKKTADMLAKDKNLRVAQDAMFHLAFAYKNGDGIRPDDRLFFSSLKEAAESGQKDAMFHLAIAYRDNEGTAHDDGQFLDWMKKAASTRLPAAMYQLALAYWEETGTTYRFQEFNYWSKEALKSGHPRAFILSGIADILSGSGYSKSKVAALRRELKELNQDLQSLFDLVEETRKRHVVKKKGNIKAAYHFTDFTALTSMLPERPSGKETNRLRLYNFAYMNDPLEGRRLLDEEISETEHLRIFFRNEKLESSVYIGSFTLRGDELDLWRAYGRDGKGVCIATPLEEFDRNPTREEHGGEVVEVSSIEENNEYVPMTLYAIHYKSEQIISALTKLNPVLIRILDKKEKIKEGSDLIDRIVREIIGRIRFLYKNEQYQSEQEARLLVDFNISFELLKFDERNPSRIFVESPIFLFTNKGSEIIFGPTVPEKTIVELNIKYRLARNPMLQNTEVKQSKVPYRQ
jgi:TPR repeat protein